METLEAGEDRWLTQTEVAERLRVPTATLAQWAYLKSGPPYGRFGRHCRYRLSDVLAWENEQIARSV